MHDLPTPWIVLPTLVAWAGCLSLRPFRKLAKPSPGRLASVDGLRGILALGVFAHHFAVCTQWQLTGAWAPTRSGAWDLLGEGGVMMFFMITGFLFFGRIYDARRLDWTSFYQGRFLRIYPAYFFSVLLVALCALMESKSAIASSRMGFLDTLGWLTFNPGRMFDMADAWVIMAGVPWSLRYEWCFYLALPAIFVLWRETKWSLWTPATLCLGSVLLASSASDSQAVLAAPFALGGVVSLIPRQSPIARLARGHAGAAVVLAGLGVVVLTQQSAFQLPCILLLAIVFTPIALGNTLLNTLNSQPMQILGMASYGIYLLHGVVLYVAFHFAWPHALGGSTLTGLAQLFGIGCVVIASAMFVHRAVEIPCMAVRFPFSARYPRNNLAVLRPEPLDQPVGAADFAKAALCSGVASV